MRKDVLIIGGGATGAGIVRDLALRGVECALLEMGDYCHGASGGNHGLLHSGGRYAVTDPPSATECAKENAILRRTAPFCIEGTDGLFVSLPGDDPSFADPFLKGCKGSGVPAEELTAKEALSAEPGLSAEALRCIAVQDGSIDPFALVQANVDSAREAGAMVRNHCRVTDMVLEGGMVVRVKAFDRRSGEILTIVPEIVINAAGAWAPQVAAMAGCEVAMGLDQGSMLVVDGRLCGHVVNRLRPPSDGDITVPNHTATVLGTTSRPAASPEDVAPSWDDMELLLRETSAMLPALRHCRVVRAYGGVRPLPGRGGRGASRTYSLITDERASNLLSVVGGKLTTYRLMAEKVSDWVCQALGARAGCRTRAEPLGPPADEAGGSVALARLRRKYGFKAGAVSLADQRMLCSCEQVLRAEAQMVLAGPDALTLSDVMRRTRAGMGYCQGLDCALSLQELMMEAGGTEPLASLTEFLEERERGQALASGDQLRQEVLRRHVLRGVYGLGERE
jgi:glycerol-3-phosphate dehydrogenase